MGASNKEFLKEIINQLEDENMGLKVTRSKNKERESVPNGTYFGRCYGVIDLGNQVQKKFESDATEVIPQVVLLFELSHKMTDGKPFGFSRICKISNHEKSNLHQIVQHLTGKLLSDESQNGFQLTQLLDKFCVLQYTENPKPDRDYPIVTFGPAPDGTKFEAVNKNVVFDCDNPNPEILKELPEWIVTKINERVKDDDAFIEEKNYDERNPPPLEDVPF
tara:strand:+ start:6438 stop:7097 length:660 start_codon:yes stop_codon:yes gene_type:complete